MDKQRAFFQLLDRIAANTWPAERSTMIDHWLVRASHGITKRANSVLAIGSYPQDDNWLTLIEQYYHSLGLPAIFHISDASPEQLDTFLQSHGYEIDIPCFMMTADSKQVAASALERFQAHSPSSLSLDVEISQTVTAEWLDAFLLLEKYPAERRSFYQSLGDRMQSNICK